MSIEKYIADIIRREGGYVNHPADTGGPTKFGITLVTLREWRDANVTAADVEALRPEEAYKIYKENYLIKPGIDKLYDHKLQALVLDTAVHSGTSRAIKFLQQSLGVVDDGILGPVSLKAANNYDAGLLRRQYLGQRLRFLGRLITGKPSQAAFAAGWMVRISELLEELS